MAWELAVLGTVLRREVATGVPVAQDTARPLPFVNPLHAILLAFPVALYPSALLADIAYLRTYLIQWSNFAQWLIAGADLFAGLVLAWAVLGVFFGRARHVQGRGLLYLAILVIMFVAGVINAFQHSKDAWHSVGTLGLVLSIACTALALAAAFVAYGRPIAGEHR